MTFLDIIKVINSPVGKWTVQSANKVEMTMNELFNDISSSREHTKQNVPCLKNEVKRQLFIENDQSKKITNIACEFYCLLLLTPLHIFLLNDYNNFTSLSTAPIKNC